jgi:hypothetical protein
MEPRRSESPVLHSLGTIPAKQAILLFRRTLFAGLFSR